MAVTGAPVADETQERLSLRPLLPVEPESTELTWSHRPSAASPLSPDLPIASLPRVPLFVSFLLLFL